MANKYISHGDTYCGDGTTSAAAASAGAVGAWNDFKAAAAGTPAYGTLAKGDVVYIRSEKSSVNLTQKLTANLVFMEGDYNNPVTFVFDDGTIWTGDNGEFQLDTDRTYEVTFSSWTIIVGQDSFRMFQSGTTATGYMYWCRGKNTDISNVYFKTNKDSTRSAWITAEGGCSPYYRNCTFEIRSSNSTGYELFYIVQYATMHLFNCKIDLSDFHTQKSCMLFECQGYYAQVFVRGLEIVGDWATLHLYGEYNHASRAGMGQFQNVKSAGNMSFIDYNFTTDIGTKMTGQYMLSGIDGKPFDFHHVYIKGMYSQWREGDSYPVLNALLPDGTTKWSILSYPRYTNLARVGRCPEMNKYFTETAATRKITLEMLISTNFSAPKKHHWWIDVFYFDSTGDVRMDTSLAWDANLVTSTASWDTTTYNTQAYSKYKIEVTTAHSIKQYSWILVVLHCATKAPGSNDFFFHDPDFTVGAP